MIAAMTDRPDFPLQQVFFGDRLLSNTGKPFHPDPAC